jgi:AAA domain
MFRTIRIHNFRTFRLLRAEGLAKINLITGKNGTGKTAFLEAPVSQCWCNQYVALPFARALSRRFGIFVLRRFNFSEFVSSIQYSTPH